MIKCPSCDEKIIKPGNTFCNLSCANSYNTKRRKKKVREIKYCPHCDKEVNYKNTYCNQSCAAKFNNKKRAKIKEIKTGRINKKFNNCNFCDKPITSRKKYCNGDCQHEAQYRDRVAKYKVETISSLGRGTLRRYLTERDGYKCNDCNIETWNGKPIVLEIEHKDGNSENNVETNLCFLCPNCHSQTSTYKGKNVGNGRAYRRKRYAEGKSY